MAVLKDFDIHGNEINRAELKLQNEKIANALRRQPFYSPKFARHCKNVANELDHCFEWAKYKQDPKTGKERLYDTRYCRRNLCRVCDRVRYNHQSARLWHITNALGDDAKYLFITFTYKNVAYDKIRKGVDTLNYAISKLMNYKSIKPYVYGGAKSIETTFGDDGKCNLHIHMLINVRPTFYGGSARLNHSQWSKLWNKALKVGYIANINVKRPKNTKDVSTLDNYLVKMDTKLDHIDWEKDRVMIQNAVEIEEEIYRKHRLTLTGIFKETDKLINAQYKRKYKRKNSVDTGKHTTYSSDDTFNYSNANIITYTYYKHGDKHYYKQKE